MSSMQGSMSTARHTFEVVSFPAIGTRSTRSEYLRHSSSVGMACGAKAPLANASKEVPGHLLFIRSNDSSRVRFVGDVLGRMMGPEDSCLHDVCDSLSK